MPKGDNAVSRPRPSSVPHRNATAQNTRPCKPPLHSAAAMTAAATGRASTVGTAPAPGLTDDATAAGADVPMAATTAVPEPVTVVGATDPVASVTEATRSGPSSLSRRSCALSSRGRSGRSRRSRRHRRRPPVVMVAGPAAPVGVPVGMPVRPAVRVLQSRPLGSLSSQSSLSSSSSFESVLGGSPLESTPVAEAGAVVVVAAALGEGRSIGRLGIAERA